MPSTKPPNKTRPLKFPQSQTFSAPSVKGHGRGRLLGFPTLNLDKPQKFTATFGIYAGWVYFRRQTLKGAFHWGPIPVFQQSTPSLEVFILNRKLPRPPRQILFQLTHYLRPIKTFSSTTALTQQIQADVDQVRSLLDPLTPPEFDSQILITQTTG